MRIIRTDKKEKSVMMTIQNIYGAKTSVCRMFNLFCWNSLIRILFCEHMTKYAFSLDFWKFVWHFRKSPWFHRRRKFLGFCCFWILLIHVKLARFHCAPVPIIIFVCVDWAPAKNSIANPPYSSILWAHNDIVLFTIYVVFLLVYDKCDSDNAAFEKWELLDIFITQH